MKRKYEEEEAAAANGGAVPGGSTSMSVANTSVGSKVGARLLNPNHSFNFYDIPFAAPP